MIAEKFFFNEFKSLSVLSTLRDNRDVKNMTRMDANGFSNWVSDRTESIVTFYLMSFGNIGSLGITLGGFGKTCCTGSSYKSVNTDTLCVYFSILRGRQFLSNRNVLRSPFQHEFE